MHPGFRFRHFSKAGRKREDKRKRMNMEQTRKLYLPHKLLFKTKTNIKIGRKDNRIFKLENKNLLIILRELT